MRWGLVIFTLLGWQLVSGIEQPAAVSGSLNVVNSVLKNDGNYLELASSTTISYSVVAGTTAPSGTANRVLSNSINWKDSIVSPANTDSYYLSPISGWLNEGNLTPGVNLPTYDINGNPRVYMDHVDIGAVEYSLIFNKGNGNWSDNTKWNIGRTSYEKDHVTITDKATVTSEDAVCTSLFFGNTNSLLQINAEKYLRVLGNIYNTQANRILIKASNSQPNGSLVFNNPKALGVHASVELCSHASIDASLSEGDLGKYKWQYIGIPFRSLSATPSFNGAWVRRFNESSTAYSKWEALTNGDTMFAFKGYEILQNNPTAYTLQGILENRDTTITVVKSAVPYFAGQHILANPYTAAIKVEDIQFTGAVEATVYIYHTGSYADWDADSEGGRIGNNAGQYLAVPQNNAAIILPEIPSMQGFLVRTSGNGSVSIPYNSTVKNTGLQKAPQKIKQAANPHLVVELISEHSYDKLWLVHEESATKGFDNGWDGYKMKSSSPSSSIYVQEENENFQISTTNDINHTKITFESGKDKDFQLNIIKHELDDYYSQVYLLDTELNAVIPIDTDTVRYNFQAIENSHYPNRFKIIGNIENDDKTGADLHFSVRGSTVVIDNFTQTEGFYSIYDITGILLSQGQLPTGTQIVTLPSGQNTLILQAQAGGARLAEKIRVKL